MVFSSNFKNHRKTLICKKRSTNSMIQMHAVTAAVGVLKANHMFRTESKIYKHNFFQFQVLIEVYVLDG